MDADGAAVLVCRYVCPVPLPPNLAQLVAGGGAAAEAGGVEALMLKLARFVSHVSVWHRSTCSTSAQHICWDARAQDAGTPHGRQILLVP